MSRLFASLLLLAASLGAADDARRPEVERAIARLSPTIVRIEVNSEDGSELQVLWMDEDGPASYQGMPEHQSQLRHVQR